MGSPTDGPSTSLFDEPVDHGWGPSFAGAAIWIVLLAIIGVPLVWWLTRASTGPTWFLYLIPPAVMLLGFALSYHFVSENRLVWPMLATVVLAAGLTSAAYQNLTVARHAPGDPYTAYLDSGGSVQAPAGSSEEQNLRNAIQSCLEGQLPTTVDPSTARDFCDLVDRVNQDTSGG